MTIAVPTRDKFAGQPYLVSHELAQLGDTLIEQHAPRFDVTREFSLDYLWQARGSHRLGEPVLADVRKPAGLTYHYAHADFVLVFAADLLLELELTDKEWAALAFEQLAKIGKRETTGAAELRPYDFGGFTACLDEYGPWRQDLKDMVRAVARQPALL